MKQEEYSTLGVIQSGKLSMRGRQLFEQAMRRFPDGPVVVAVKTTKLQRSLAQNKFWHGVVIPLFAEHCGYELQEMKDALSLKLIPLEITDMDTGEVRIVPGHTSALNVKGFNDLIERAQRLGAEMDLYIPNPGEVAA